MWPFATAMKYLAFICTFCLGFSATAQITYTALSKHSRWEYNNQDAELTGQFNTPFFTDNPLLYNEDDWQTNRAPLGYGYTNLNTNVADSSLSETTHTYYFINDEALFLYRAPNIDSVFLNISYDDGFVAYLNGVEVARRNMAPVHTSNTAASSKHPASSYEKIDISAFKYLLAPLNYVDNVLAIEVHQSEPADDSLFFDASLTYVVNAEESPVDLVTMGPYLNMGTPSSAIVRWYTNNPTPSVLSYGTDPLNLDSTITLSADTREHIVNVTGLEPDTKYYYSIDGVPSYVNIPTDQYFFTSPEKDAKADARIWVLGDFGVLLPTQFIVYQDYLLRNAGQETDLWMWLGDNAYDKGTFAEYQTNVFAVYPQVLKNHMLLPSLGNHDVKACQTLIDEGPYFDMFSLPSQGEAGGVPSGTEAYYSYDHGDIHFICLESTDNNRMPGGKMLTWLKEDLQANTAKWTVAFWHHPPYSKGTHDSDTDGRMTEMRTEVNPLLEKYGVDLVLTGHSHDYERSYLIDEHYGLSETFDPDSHAVGGLRTGALDTDEIYRKPKRRVGNRGTVYAVVGAGGSIYDEGSMDHAAMHYNSIIPGSMILEINGDTLKASYINVSRPLSNEDEFYIIKEDQNLPCVANLNLPDTVLLCNGQTEQIGVADTYWSYHWNTGETTPVLNIDSAGSYVLTAQVFEGCEIIDTTVAVAAGLNITHSINPPRFCEGDSMLLSANTTANDVLWSTSQTTKDIWVSSGGTYSVTASYSNCSITDSIGVVMDSALTINWIVPDTLLELGTPDVFKDITPNVQDRVWNFGNGTTSTLDSVTVTYFNTGDYTVALDVFNPTCSDTRQQGFTVSQTSRVATLNNSMFSVTPNPFKDYVDIQLKQNGVTTIALMDVSGKVLEEREPKQDTLRLSLGDLESGTYFLVFRTAQGVQSVMLQKQ